MRPNQMRQKISESGRDISNLEARAFLIDRLSSDSFHALETAEESDEKADAMHSALMELIGGRNK